MNPDKVYHELMEAGRDYADKEAAASLLEETKKTVLAQEMAKYPGMSNAAAESQALASESYREHLERMVEARKAANVAKVRYYAVQTLAELRRTAESTRRAEMMLAK